MLYAKELTSLKDSIDEKKRELTFSQQILAEKDRNLYDKKQVFHIFDIFF